MNYKKIWCHAVLASVIALSIMSAGCAKKQEQPVETTVAETSAPAQSEPENTALSNPMAEVDSVLAFEKIGVHMVLPEDVAEPAYFIINGEVADVRFSLNDVAYTYRASDTAEDFAGIFERFTEDVMTETCGSGEQQTQIEIKTTESGGRLAAWEWGSTKYSLYTSSPVSDADIRDLAFSLAELSENVK